MSPVAVEYVRRTPEGAWLVAESRVSLDSIIQAYWEGRSPEAIVDEFPALTAEQVYGAITFYLRHKAEIDAHLAEQAVRWQELQRSTESRHGAIFHSENGSSGTRYRPSSIASRSTRRLTTTPESPAARTRNWPAEGS